MGGEGQSCRWNVQINCALQAQIRPGKVPCIMTGPVDRVVAGAALEREAIHGCSWLSRFWWNYVSKLSSVYQAAFHVDTYCMAQNGGH